MACIKKEWIAYHYHMVKLRHLVICQDPYSDSSPLEIVNRWRNLGLMTIDLWTEGIKRKIKLTKNILINSYLARQKICYEKCMKFLNNSNRSWTMMIDADEYLTFNPVTNDDNEFTYAKVNRSDPNSSYKYIGEMIIDKTMDSKRKKRRLYRRENLMKARLRVPRDFLSNCNKTIADFIHEERSNMPWSKPCVVFPRLQFSDRVEVTHNMSSVIQASNFTTLKHFTHGKKGSLEDNRAGKSIVDVSRMPTFKVQNPHSIRTDLVSL